MGVTVDDAESPLAWLARRRGRDGRTLIEPHQLQAGERLRADFTRANLMQRTTSNWASPISSDRRGAGGDRSSAFTETMIAARQRVHQALDAVGPEFSGLLLDVCCFLNGQAVLWHPALLLTADGLPTAGCLETRSRKSGSASIRSSAN